MRQLKEVGITYFGFAFGTFFSLGCAQVSGKRGNKRDENEKSDTEKNTRLGGCDLTFSAFIRPKSSWRRSRPSRTKRDRILSACPAGAVTQGM